ncbi:hypothetical protein H2199_004658 [Coniosporium tulheliwenetii]|uniref:Uncharacterized protein n=1 Tax=Coniosporium tulheliwenetii TaxID=3383036 RepID=A0ACC2Z3P2_9PEZI|nr:hypothetical protein H2199_004658 [Cladosporium sp. JES 115]
MSGRYQYCDLVVIGSGIYGISAARTYLEVHPHRNVIIFEASATIGGVWSAGRIYDDFITQTPLGMAEFSDRALKDVPQDDQYYGFFKAQHVTRYLASYVKEHLYGDKSIADRIHFNAPVERLSKQDGQWSVVVKGCKPIYKAPQVIDASGLTSTPHIPSIPGKDAFQGLSLHHKDFGQSDVLTNSRYQGFVVLGGAKSAADVAYAAARSHKRVTWIIRKSGVGPAAFVPAQGRGPYKNSNESFYNRLTASFLASAFHSENWWTQFLYRTRVGRQLWNWIWAGINAGPQKLAKFDRPDGRKNGFANLKPDTPLFWQNDSTGIVQRADFFDTIATQVRVIRQDIRSMNEEGLMLDDGTAVAADAIVYCTGWKICHPYLDNETAAQLGLPVHQDFCPPQEIVRWQALDRKGEIKALERFPILCEPPSHLASTSALSPLRLYKGMLPPHDHSIIFLGKLMLGNHFRNAEVQALWAVAALDGNICFPSTEDIGAEIADTVAWCRKRYLSKGELGNWLYFDMVPYTDTLLEQLGLKSHRKTWPKDLLAPCVARDLRGLVNEYKELHQPPNGRKS